MATKAEQFGCTSEREASCEHWTPPERAGIGGAPTDPKGSGRCELEKRMVRRMSSCPKTGKAYDKRTKVEKFGCKTCKGYNEPGKGNDWTVPFCMAGGTMFGSISALNNCPLQGEKATTRFGCEDGETRCRHLLRTHVRGEFGACSLSGKNLTEIEECPEKKPDAVQTLMKRAPCCVATGLDGDTCDTACCYYVVNSGSPFCELVDKERMMEDAMDGRRRAGDILDAGAGATPDLREVPEVELGIQRQDGEVLDTSEADTGITGVSTAGVGGVRVLALDVSTKCTGWALREGDRVTEHGSVKASGDDSERRKEIMRQGILPFLQQPLHYVVLERSFIAGSGDTSRLICETQGILKNLVHRLGHRLLEPNPTTWRSIFPGSGRCDKEAAIDAARLKDHVFESHDEAEAICLAYSFGPKLLEILEQGKIKKNGKKKNVPSSDTGKGRKSNRGGLPAPDTSSQAA